MSEIGCEKVKEPSISDKEQIILSALREIRMKLVAIHSNIVGNERCIDENQGSPSCFMETVDMNAQLVSDINVLVDDITNILF